VKPSPEGTAFHAAVVVMVKVSDSPASPPSTRSSVLTVSVAAVLVVVVVAGGWAGDGEN